MLKSYIKVREALIGLGKNEDGASLAEYALLIALVLIGASVALVTLTGAVTGALDTGSNCLGDPVNGC